MPSSKSSSSNGHAANGAANGAAKSAALGAAQTGVVERHATVGDIAALLGAEIVGDAETLITGVAAIESARPGSILFIENEQLLIQALASTAAAIIAPMAVEASVRRIERKSGKPTLLIGNPRLAFAKVMEYFQPHSLPEPGIHATAIIAPDEIGS